MIASFLNSGPFAPKVMEKFTDASQDILTSLECATLWKKEKDGLFTPAGKESRYQWVRTALNWIDRPETSNKRVISMYSILCKCPEPPVSNNI